MRSTPSTATRAFFSFPRVIDPARHGDYNAWHLLDHRPQNLALPGVVHGDRWVRTPRCEQVGSYPDEVLAGSQYVAMYWFAEPAEESIREWVALGDSTYHEGRRPELAWTARPMTRMFIPIRGYVSAHTRVTVDALPFRPHRGVHIEVSSVPAAQQSPVADLAQFEHETHVADLLGRDGVSGLWTFRSAPLGPGDTGSLLRIRLIWLEGDPVAFTESLSSDPLSMPPDGLADVATPMWSGPLQTIQPWEWDWFDRLS